MQCLNTQSIKGSKDTHHCEVLPSGEQCLGRKNQAKTHTDTLWVIFNVRLAVATTSAYLSLKLNRVQMPSHKDTGRSAKENIPVFTICFDISEVIYSLGLVDGQVFGEV